MLPVTTRGIPENHHNHCVGIVIVFSSQVTGDDFVQEMWRAVLAKKQPGQRENLIDKVAVLCVVRRMILGSRFTVAPLEDMCIFHC